MVERTHRRLALAAVAALSRAGHPVRGACVLTGISKDRFYRSRRQDNDAGPPPEPIHQRERAYAHRITAGEAAAFLDELTGPVYGHLSVTEAWQRMVDAGRYHCSAATAHRLVRKAGLTGDWRRQRAPVPGRTRPKPVLAATAPNQVWCWDVTELTGPGRARYKLFTIMDLFSRAAVGHHVATEEGAATAAAFLTEAITASSTVPGIVHADNGSAMRAGSTHELYARFGIRPSHSRPRVSDDNPHIEALFKTVKYTPTIPVRFTDLDAARTWCQEFFTDYNDHHRHSGLNGYTPASVHHGTWPAIHAARTTARAAYDRAHPARARPGHTLKTPPTQAWINQPLNPINPQLSQTA